VAVEYGGTVLLADVLMDLALALGSPSNTQQQQQQQQQQQRQQREGQPPHLWRLWGWRQRAQSHTGVSCQQQIPVGTAAATAAAVSAGEYLQGKGEASGWVGSTTGPGREGEGGYPQAADEGAQCVVVEEGRLHASVCVPEAVLRQAAEEAVGLLASLLGSASHGTAISLMLQVGGSV